MSERSEARGAAAAHVVEVPVDLVEFEARLLALERRVREQEARDQLMLGVSEELRRLTEALGPLLEVVGPLAESREGLPHAPPAPVSRRPLAPRSPAPSVGASSPTEVLAVEPERLAAAQARLREAARPVLTPPIETAQPLRDPPTDPPQPAPAPSTDAAQRAPLASVSPAGRRSWLLKSLRRMAARDPDSAGRVLVALLAAERLARNGPVPRLPGPPATVARVVVKGRLRRRLEWEMAQLACELTTVSALAKLVRLGVSPTELHAAGVRLDPPVVFALVACAIDPRWTLGHRFTLAHLDASPAYLQVRDARRPTVHDEAPAGFVQTTVRCRADALLPLLAGEPGVVATVEGERRPLELVQGWFQDATSA